MEEKKINLFVYGSLRDRRVFKSVCGLTFGHKPAQMLILKILGALNAGSVIKALAGIDALAKEVYAFMPYTPLFNVTGQPAMSVPLHWNDEGLPIGMHFVGKWGDEATLFRLAGQLEKAKPWFDKTPIGY